MYEHKNYAENMKNEKTLLCLSFYFILFINVSLQKIKISLIKKIYVNLCPHISFLVFFVCVSFGCLFASHLLPFFFSLSLFSVVCSLCFFFLFLKTFFFLLLLLNEVEIQLSRARLKKNHYEKHFSSLYDTMKF